MTGCDADRHRAPSILGSAVSMKACHRPTPPPWPPPRCPGSRHRRPSPRPRHRPPTARRRLRRALSFDVIPPRSATQAERMPQLLRFLDSLSPDYLAVTSSAKSDWLRGTADFIAEVTSTTTLRPLAHLACTAGTES